MPVIKRTFAEKILHLEIKNLGTKIIKMHSRLKYFISAFLLITISCKQQSEREQITDTTKKILQSIQENRESDFLNLIGVPLKVLGKSNSMVHSDFEKIKVRFKEHNLDPTIQINDTPNYMGQKLVPIF